MTTFTHFSSERLLLRPFAESDTDSIHSYRSLECVAKYQYWHPFSKEEVVELIRKNMQQPVGIRGVWSGLAITCKDSSMLIGDCAFKLNDVNAEVGCNISPVYQQKGYAREALAILCTYIFKDISGVSEIYAITDAENIASAKLLESIGMTKTRDHEEVVLCKGRLSVEHKYSIFRTAWLAR